MQASRCDVGEAGGRRVVGWWPESCPRAANLKSAPRQRATPSPAADPDAPRSLVVGEPVRGCMHRVIRRGAAQMARAYPSYAGAAGLQP